ncbi:MAG: Trm112 family protein [Anaerolineae bacterium]|nr:Trm112 family protein [Anaerolineae bacterium]
MGGEVAADLLEILVDPADKQPLELVDGKWLVNRRTGRRYPIVTGIPIMLPEVGDKYRDPSLITIHNGNGAA